jgi:hypothetical protein
MKGRQGWSRIVALTVLLHVLVATSAGARAFSLSVVFVQQDTTRPPVPPLPNLPSDSTFTVESPRYPRSQLLYYRNILRISFDDSTSGTTIRNLFKRYSATVIGGIPGPVEPEYLLQVPDPGATLEALDSLLNQLNQEPGVRWAASVYYRTPGSIYWRHPNSPGSNSVCSPWSGIVQDYGSLSVLFVQEDTTRPPVPQSPVLPDDSTRTVPSPSGTAERYYRDIVGVMLDDTTSGRTIRAILKKYQASIIAGGVAFPHPLYYLQVPDPGGTYAAISSVAKAIDGEPGVFAVLIPQWRGRLQIRSRYPNDGPSARMADWFSASLTP